MRRAATPQCPEWTRATHARTSTTDPIRIDWLQLDGPGALGLTLAPGKRAHGVDGLWQRDLDADLARLRGLGVTVLASLLPNRELAMLGIAELPERAAQVGLGVRRHAFDDGHVPSDMDAFAAFLERLASDVQNGEHVVVHCRGGLGRAGLTVSCLLLLLGAATSATDAIAQVRAARSPRAVETLEQEAFVARYAQRMGCRG